MNKYKAIILAAGMGTRMKSDLPKALGTVYDKTIIEELIYSLSTADINEVCLVIGHKGDMIKDKLSYLNNISYAVQQQQLGTGHAVLMTKDMIKKDENILIVYGDMPFISKSTLSHFISNFEQSNVDVSMITATPDPTPAYGRIVRNSDGYVVDIIEQKDADEEIKKIKEVNYGIYLFKGDVLIQTLNMLDNNNAAGEYYLTDTIRHAANLGKKINSYILENPEECKGVNSRIELEKVVKTLFEINCNKHLDNGVTIVSKSNTFIGSEVEIGKDTIIFPGTNLMGKCKIGSNCKIGPNVTLKDKIVEDGNIIE